MGRIVAILAAWAAVLVAAAPAAADPVDHTPPDVPTVTVQSHWTQGLEDVDATVSDVDWSHLIRISNAPAVDAEGMLVDGVTTSTDPVYSWDVTDPATGGNAVDGPHDIYVQAQDLAGNWGAVGGAEVILDRTPPVVTAARARFVNGWAVIAPKIGVDWDVSETDANCFVSCSAPGYAQVSLDGAIWDAFGAFDGGGTYQVRAQQTDAAGNASGWTAVAPVTVSERQESSTAIAHTGRWTQHAAETAYGGGYRSTIRGGSALRTTITASNLLVVGTATNGGGSVRVYLDGVLKGTVSERGVGAVDLLRADFAKVSSHTIKLVAVASSGHRATFDAILALRQPA